MTDLWRKREGRFWSVAPRGPILLKDCFGRAAVIAFEVHHRLLSGRKLALPCFAAVLQRLTFTLRALCWGRLRWRGSLAEFDEQCLLGGEAFLARALAAVVAALVHDPRLGVVGEVGQQAFLEVEMDKQHHRISKASWWKLNLL